MSRLLARLSPPLILAATVLALLRRQRPPARLVRDAGPEAMRSPPRDWDIVDQQADESFPASDPPGNY